MIILHDPRCADYGSSARPEQPFRVTSTVQHLRQAHPDWTWRVPSTEMNEAVLQRAHTAAHLRRLDQPEDFDADTPFFPGISAHARRGVGAALEAGQLALRGEKVFSLMRPPGHHALADHAMGFCYLNPVAITALDLVARGAKRVAVWDFDAHHGNGTEALLHNRENILFTSVHQYPGYPGTGTRSFDNCRNWPVPPLSPRKTHLAALAESWVAVRAFEPDIVLISSGFDAYVNDPITEMTLDIEDFATLGRWVRESGLPAAGILEGGYASNLCLLIDAFLSAWNSGPVKAA